MKGKRNTYVVGRSAGFVPLRRTSSSPLAMGTPPVDATLRHSTQQSTNNSTMKLLSLFTALVAAGTAAAFAPAKIGARSVVSTNMAASEELYIDEERRFLMNLILVGSAALTVGAIGVPYIAFFVPPGSGGGAGGIPAKDALGNDIFAQAYLDSKPANDRSLAQGLKGDATYLIVKEDKKLESYGLNAGK